MDQVLLAVGEQVLHRNISYASCMCSRNIGFVNGLIESGLYLNEEFIKVSQLVVPSTITVSGVPHLCQMRHWKENSSASRCLQTVSEQ